MKSQNRNIRTSTAVLRIVLLVAAALFLITGVFRNGPADVKNKAVRICYECIGIG